MNAIQDLYINTGIITKDFYFTLSDGIELDLKFKKEDSGVVLRCIKEND